VAKSYLSAFEITVGDSAEPAPSSRSSLKLRLSRDSAISIVLDVWGGSPSFAAADLREAICGPIR
jgi:hypothetical protein